MGSSVIRRVLELAAEVFEEPVRGEDSIADLGVDSFLVLSLCDRLEEQLGVEVDLERLLTAPSLAAFAEELTTASVGTADD